MKKENKLREFALSVIEGSLINKEVNAMMDSLSISKKEIVEGYLFYSLDVMAYSNEVYENLGTRFAMYIQTLLPGSWHIKRQNVVFNMINKIKPKSIVDMGFGIPGKYIKDYVLKNDVDLLLVDFYDSAFDFSEKLLDIWDSKWKENISFKNLDMNQEKYIDDYDCFLFMDSIEHVNNPSRYLKRTVKKSRPGSKFIFSIPIGPMIPSHKIGWKDKEEAVNWLEECGLKIDSEEKVYPNKKVDIFAAELSEEIYDLIITCSKKNNVKNLPLLDDLSALYSGDSLENTLLIVCQHILISNFVLLDYLIKFGINPKDIFLIGKSYSTSSRTMKDYKRLGINVDEKSLAFDSHKSFDQQFSKYVKGFLKNICKKDLSKYEKIIILDDGGQLLIHANEFFGGDERVVGVEQTSSGYSRVNKLDLNFPIINVATSEAKLNYETPMIVEAISKEIHKRLRQIDVNIKNILIIGNGPIGKGIAEDLRKDFSVCIYDKMKKRSEISKKEFEIKITECDLIIGCSGEKVILESFYHLLKKKVILVSASSSDREFESHKIRKNHAKTSNTHKDFYTNEIILLNGGFPLNFDGHKTSVPLEDIQLTLSLMFAAVIQAIQTPHIRKIVELNSKIQDFIINKFEELS